MFYSLETIERLLYTATKIIIFLISEQVITGMAVWVTAQMWKQTLV